MTGIYTTTETEPQLQTAIDANLALTIMKQQVLPYRLYQS